MKKTSLSSTAMNELACVGAMCRWIDGCLLPTGSTASGMYAKCATECWSQANPFKNDLSGRVALFDFETVYRKGQVHTPFPPTLPSQPAILQLPSLVLTPTGLLEKQSS